MADVSVSHPRGDSVERSYAVTDFDMDVTTLRGLTIYITIKREIDDDRSDLAAVHQAVLSVDTEGEVKAAQNMYVGGIDPRTDLEVEGVDSGVFTHLVVPEDSTMFEVGEYVYDVQVTTSHEPPRVKTVIEAAPWTVRADVTGRFLPPVEEGGEQ